MKMPTMYAIVWALVCTSILGFIGESLLCVNLYGRPHVRGSPVTVLPLLKESFLTFVMGALTLFSSRIIVILLSYFDTDYSVGLFHAASRFPEALGLVNMALVGPLFPILSNKFAVNPAAFRVVFETTVKYLCGIVMFMATVLLQVIPIIVPFMLGSSYQQSGAIAAWLLAAQSFFMLWTLYYVGAYAAGELKSCITIGVITLTANICCGIPLILFYGVWGAVMAQIITFSLFLPVGLLIPKLRFFSVTMLKNLVNPFIAGNAAVGITLLLRWHWGLEVPLSAFVYGIVYIVLGSIKERDFELLQEIFPKLSISERWKRILIRSHLLFVVEQ